MSGDTTTLPAHNLGAPVPGDNNIASLSPFGLGHDKPKDFSRMLDLAWGNRDQLGYTWRILTRSVCDGCSLGSRGLWDTGIEGIHLCTSRLKRIRSSTSPPLHPQELDNIRYLRNMNDQQLRDLGRLSYPMVYRPGDRGFSRTSWNEALDLIAERITTLAGDRMGWTSAPSGLTNEAYYAFGKAARLMSTNNVDMCTRHTHASVVAGLKRTVGVGAATCSLSDLIGTNLILLWGSDVTHKQPAFARYLAEAKARGTRVVVIDTTLRSDLERAWVPSMPVSALFGTRLIDDFVQLNAGGDIAFISGVLKHVVATSAQHEAYINAHTRGFAAVADKVRSLTWAGLERISGASRREMEWIGELFVRANSCVSVYSSDLTQRTHGVQSVESIVNLHLSRGMVGREKCGVLPIGEHSGMSGGSECGVCPGSFPGGRTLSHETATEMSALWGANVAAWKGQSTVSMVKSAHRGEIDFFYNMGGDLFKTMADPNTVTEALSRVGLRVHQDVELNRSMLVDPGELLILLPAQTPHEQRGGGICTSIERRIRFNPEIEGHPQTGEARPAWEIPGQIAVRAREGLAHAFNYRGAQDVRNEMGRTMPLYTGVETLRHAGDHIQWGGTRLGADGFKNMPAGKASFTVIDPPDCLAPDGQWMLTACCDEPPEDSADSDSTHGADHYGRDELFMNAGDMANMGLADGAHVRVHNDHGSWYARLYSMSIKPGVVQASWPECSAVIPFSMDSNTSESGCTAAVHIETR